MLRLLPREGRCSCSHAPPAPTPAGLVALGLAAALAAGSLSETLLVNAYFHILFRMCAHLKVSPKRLAMPLNASPCWQETHTLGWA